MNLKNRIYFLIIISVSTSLKAQNLVDKVLTDTTMAVGVVADGVFVGNSIGSYCINSVDKYLKKGTAVIISGIEKCKKSYSNDITTFFEIIYNNKTYFIEKEKLYTGSTYYSQIESMTYSKADSFRTYAKKVGQILYEGKIDKLLKFLNSCKPKGLTILNWSFYDESEYTKGTSIKIKIYNPTPKTIKYLWFTFVGFNPVGDKVGENKTVKGVGPIKPDESGSYEYTYVWFTDLVETARILTIKVQYMDGTFKTITKPAEIILSDELYEQLSEED